LKEPGELLLLTLGVLFDGVNPGVEPGPGVYAALELGV